MDGVCVNNSLEFRLLNEFQRDFPLCPAPFAELAARDGLAVHGITLSPAQLAYAQERMARASLDDRVQFSRVLADWDPAVCQMLLHKSKAALNPGGSIVISEPFDDTNKDLAISWEYRYTFYDDFGVHTYKSIAEYSRMLKEAGMSSVHVVDRIDDTLYGVLTAS
mgnify:CR=1 FL=1